MKKSVPINVIDGIELLQTGRSGVRHVKVVDPEAKQTLSWDRFIRLKAAADAVRHIVDPTGSILDVGGYDGALGLFLPEYKLDLMDPATTGASLLHEPAADQSYDLVTAIDVLEHIVPTERINALAELCRVARRYVVLNYPGKETSEAQELVLELTNNALVREHVQWELPDNNWVLETMAGLGFKGSVQAYGSVAVWVGQYLTMNLAPEAADKLNRYLIDKHLGEPGSVPLYHLVVCERRAGDVCT